MTSGPQSFSSALSGPIISSWSREGLTSKEADRLLERWGNWVRQERILGYYRVNVLWYLSRKKGDGLSGSGFECADEEMAIVDRLVASLPIREKMVVKYWYVFGWDRHRIRGRFRLSERSIYRCLDRAKHLLMSL